MGMKELTINRRDFLIQAVGTSIFLMAPGLLVCTPQQNKPTGFHYDDVYLRHITGNDHPESPARLEAIIDTVKKADWHRDLLLVPSREADPSEVALAHGMDYINLVKKECESGSTRLSTGDTVICEESYSVALHAVGGVLNAVDSVCTNKAKNAFCAIRPPGHHASSDRGMGFCIFNNIAVAARYAQKKYQIERILIVDWDVHHGNGTQDIFYSDDTVFFMSTHQSPLYPGTGKVEETGAGIGKGFTMNRPFPPGAGNKELMHAFKNDLLPAARKFKPDLTLISAGFDSRTGDRLGSFEVDDNGFRELTKIMLEIAHINGNGRLISVLEGGYTLQGLASAVHAHIDELQKA